MSSTTTLTEPICFQTHPDQYRHWKLSFNGDIATLSMNVDPMEACARATSSS
ncbi:MAG: hypothetical protein R3E96_10630 [Planctomycetota bacterium]